MKIVDARSGAVVEVGQTIDHGDGTGYTLVEVHDLGFWRAKARIRHTKSGGLYEIEMKVRSRISLERVAVIPT